MLGHLVDTWSLFYHKTGCLHGFTVCFFYNTLCLPTNFFTYCHKRWGKLMINLTQKNPGKKKNELLQEAEEVLVLLVLVELVEVVLVVVLVEVVLLVVLVTSKKKPPVDQF